MIKLGKPTSSKAMWLATDGGRFYLFYSGNDFATPNYGIGVAVADSPLGPFIKQPMPILQSTADWVAPGHPSFARIQGEPTLFFHAYRPGAVNFKEFRALLAVQIAFERDGCSDLIVEPEAAIVSSVGQTPYAQNIRTVFVPSVCGCYARLER